MATTIERLELEVQSNTASAVSGLEALSETLGKVKTAAKGGMGLTSVSKRLESLNTALSALNTGNFDKISKVAESLEKLKSVSGVKISPSIAFEDQRGGGYAEQYEFRRHPDHEERPCAAEQCDSKRGTEKYDQPAKVRREAAGHSERRGLDRDARTD